MRRGQFRIGTVRTDERSIVRDGSFGEINFTLRQFRHVGFAPAQALRNDRSGRPRDPVRDAERVVFRKVAVIENKDEVAFSRSNALNRVSPSAWKIPDVARTERVRLATCRHPGTVRMQNRGSAVSGNDIAPLGGVCVPVHFPHGAGFKAHGYAGYSPAGGKFMHGRAACYPAWAEPGLFLFKTVTKRHFRRIAHG